MFGLRQQIVAGLFLAALLVILGAGLYIRHVFNDRADLQLKAAQQASVIAGHKRTEQALRDAAANSERAYADNARQKAKLAAELRQARSDFVEMLRSSPEVRAWADVGLPGPYLDGLRQRTGATRAGSHPDPPARGAAD
jgi:hypothetical protein